MAAPSVSNWQAQILHGIGAPVTPQNLLFLNSWTRAEGGNASFNPFNTTQSAPGATSYNSVGVRNYASPEQGINATVQTLLNGRYGNILAALRQGANARVAATALANSPWGTGSLVLKMLGGSNPPPRASMPSPGLTEPPRATRKGLSPQLLALFNQGNQLLGLRPLSQAFASAPSRQPAQGAPSLPPASSAVPSAKGKRAVNLAAKQLGIPYVWGGESTKGFDCSGLLQYVWAKQGVQIPRTTYDQFRSGTPVNANQLQAGDAVFFKGSDSKTINGQILPGHVGIYIGGGKFIEAPRTGLNVRISSLKGRTDFMGGRRY